MLKKNTVYFALKTNNLEIINLLVKKGADLNEHVREEMSFETIFSFIKNSIKISVEEYIQMNKFCFYMHKSRLEQAVECCDIKTILWLIDNGAKPFNSNVLKNRFAGFIFPALYLAIFLNRPEVVSLLLTKKLASLEDKAYLYLYDRVTGRTDIVYNLTVSDYALQLKDNKDRSEIMRILNNNLAKLTT